MILVADTTVSRVAGRDPKSTFDAPVNEVPVRVTVLAPARGPSVGETAVTVGTAWYVYRFCGAPALVPLGVVTRTLTVPAVAAGTTAVIFVADATVKRVAGRVPKRTFEAPVNVVPVRVTVFPPTSGPAEGETAVTVGADAAEAGRLGAKAEPTPKATVTAQERNPAVDQRAVGRIMGLFRGNRPFASEPSAASGSVGWKCATRVRP
ncbi:MAG: hypothetical protein WAW82_11850 [Candidatus Lutibacillus vidarii]